MSSYNYFLREKKWRKVSVVFAVMKNWLGLDCGINSSDYNWLWLECSIICFRLKFSIAR
jgi:hypothetical protein